MANVVSGRNNNINFNSNINGPSNNYGGTIRVNKVETSENNTAFSTSVKPKITEEYDFGFSQPKTIIDYLEDPSLDAIRSSNAEIE